jgi:predicted ABC-class ATPase
MGSGLMTMAHRIGQVISQRAPLMIIDEDRAVPNLLVRSCIQHGEVTPLAGILSRERTKPGDTTLIFAACALDTLIAQADRILFLDRHTATAIDRGRFRSMVRESLLRIVEG